MILRAPILLFATVWSALVVILTQDAVTEDVRAVMMGTLGLALACPGGALALFFFFLGMIGGDSPGTPLTVFFYEVFSALLLGILIRYSIWRDGSAAQTLKVKNHPITLFLWLFVLSGLLSLTSLPLTGLFAGWGRIEYHLMSQFLGSREYTPLLPVLDSLYQLQSLAVFFLIADYPKAFRGNSKVWTLSLLAGYLIVLVSGLLEFYGIIALRSLPFLGPLLSPTGFERIQSFFGNPTWYAEYLTVIAPFSMILLLLNLPQKLRLGLVVLILIVTEVSLILTMSRGGWLSYPLTLIAMWIAYYTLIREKGEDKPRRFVIRKLIKKIGLSIPITLAISLSIVGYLNSLPRASSGSTSGPGQDAYLARAQQMKNANERLRYFQPMKVLLAEHPILGGGQNSWGYRMMNEYRKPDGAHFGADTRFGEGGSIEFGSAHNLYFQTLAGKGVIGLLILVGLLGTSVVMAGQSALLGRNGGLSSSQKVFSMMMLAYTFAFIIYGNVQEDFYVPALTLLFFMAFGIFVEAVPASFQVSKRLAWSLSTLIAFAFIGHLFWEYRLPGVTRLENAHQEFGCLDDLGEHPGSTTEWCGQRFRVGRPIFSINGEPHAFMRLIYDHEDPNHTGMTLKVSAGDQPLSPVSIPKGGPIWLDLKLPKGQPGDTIKLLFEAQEAFVPARDFLSGQGISQRIAVQKTFEKSPLAFQDLGAAACASIPQWGNAILLNCRKGGSLPPLPSNPDLSKLSISLPFGQTTPLAPAWLVLKEAEGRYQMRQIKDTKWHSFAELGLQPRSDEVWTFDVVSGYPERPESIPFAVMLKP